MATLFTSRTMHYHPLTVHVMRRDDTPPPPPRSHWPPCCCRGDSSAATPTTRVSQHTWRLPLQLPSSGVLTAPTVIHVIREYLQAQPTLASCQALLAAETPVWLLQVMFGRDLGRRVRHTDEFVFDGLTAALRDTNNQLSAGADVPPSYAFSRFQVTLTL